MFTPAMYFLASETKFFFLLINCAGLSKDPFWSIAPSYKFSSFSSEVNSRELLAAFIEYKL